jgi:uncharacterized membrane protein
MSFNALIHTHKICYLDCFASFWFYLCLLCPCCFGHLPGKCISPRIPDQLTFEFEGKAAQMSKVVSVSKVISMSSLKSYSIQYPNARFCSIRFNTMDGKSHRNEGLYCIIGLSVFLLVGICIASLYKTKTIPLTVLTSLLMIGQLIQKRTTDLEYYNKYRTR